jgi:hypothetical protein
MLFPLKKRLSIQATRWREQARTLPPGPDREELLRKAQQTSVAAALNEWLACPRSSATKVSH